MSNAKPPLGTAKFLLRESMQERRFFIAVLFSPFAALFLGVAVPFKISNILAKVAGSQPESVTVNDFAILLLFVGIGVICNRISFYYLLQSQAKTMEKLQNKCLDVLLRRGSTFFDNQMSGKLTSDVFSLNDSIMQFQDAILINTLPFTVNILVGIAIVGYFSLPIALGLFFMTSIILIMAYRTSKNRKFFRHRRHEAQRKLRGYFADVITNNATVRLFARENFEKNKHAKLNQTLVEMRIEDWRRVTNDGSNRIAVVLLLQLLFIAFVARQVSLDPALLATGIFAFTFTVSLSNRLFEITNMIRAYENSLTNAAPMVAILQEEPEIIDQPIPLPFHPKHGEIILENVTFWHEEQTASDPLFSKLSLHIKAGEKVGLVGPSGGGKTTITKLLLRFMDIQDGMIKIDGHDIAKIAQSDLRQAISYVPQEPLLFHRSIKENIAYGNTKAGINKIISVARQSHAEEFIKNLPLGYDTVVGERGVKLSGGQRQRIAIARAMLKDAPILVLDEATSALDSESEILIQEALWKLMKHKTAVVIAHRLSTIQKLDRIVVLDKGRIIEQGTHAELIKKKGLYAKLWKHQSGGFLQED